MRDRREREEDPPYWVPRNERGKLLPRVFDKDRKDYTTAEIWIERVLFLIFMCIFVAIPVSIAFLFLVWLKH
jgi:hypothetical protein